MKKANFLYIFTSLTFLFQFYISLPAWYPGQNDFPKIPAFSFLDFVFPVGAQYFLFFFLILSCGLILFEKTRKVSVYIFCITVFVLVLEDINRLQPWLWMHGLLLLFWIISSPDKIFGIARFVLICMYVWSGIYKLNLNFAWEVFPYYMKALGWGEYFYLPFDELGNFPMPAINHLAWIVPFSELLIAVLLVTKYFKIGVYFAVSLHLMILLLLGPLGNSWNEIVWIWNLEIILLLIFVFGSGNKWDLSFVSAKTKSISISLIAIFAIVPAWWLFGYFPQNLSFHLYSGQNTYYHFYTKEPDRQFLEGDKQNWYIPSQKKDEILFWSFYYAMDKTKLPSFPSRYHYIITGKKLCDCYDYSGSDKAGIIIYSYKNFASEIVEERISCEELEKL